uniref:Zinc knuckle CX2CX4HX4C domain-containing protein n=1 Tax=Fagus sylvatica TaxID=28930 RepID=A0A2N9FF77_FAGSY
MDDCEVLEGFKKIKLTEDEEENILISVERRGNILEECSLSLFGSFLMGKPFNQRAVRDTPDEGFEDGAGFKDPGGRGGFVTSPERERYWVDYRYERLPHFCFACGCLGHDMRWCKVNRERVESGTASYGEWLKATFNGKLAVPRVNREGCDDVGSPMTELLGGVNGEPMAIDLGDVTGETDGTLMQQKSEKGAISEVTSDAVEERAKKTRKLGEGWNTNLVSKKAFTTEESSEMRFKERQVGQDNFVSESIQMEKGVVHVAEVTEDFRLSDPAGASRVDHTQYLKIVTVPNEISDKSEINIQLSNGEVDHSRGHEIGVGEREITKVQSVVVKTRDNVERTEDRVALKQIDEVGNWIQPKWKRTGKNSFMQVENDIKNRSGGGCGCGSGRRLVYSLADRNEDHKLELVGDSGTPSQFGLFTIWSEDFRRWESWVLLDQLNGLGQHPWVCCGDFNEIMYQKEKRGVMNLCGIITEGGRLISKKDWIVLLLPQHG